MLLKRPFDVVASAVGLLLLSPMFPLIGDRDQARRRGPVFFFQVRAGVEGVPFRLFKFRTMGADAEERLAEVVRIEELDDPMFKLRDDPRVTRVGRFSPRARRRDAAALQRPAG